MSDIQKRLLAAAEAARHNAYAKYSGFKVGAAILADDGGIYAGANVENASYPEGQCAETSAIGAMVSNGGRAIREMVVLGEGFCTPCGGCRQRIKEFSDKTTLLHIANPQGILRVFKIDELLPAPFGLEPPLSR